MMSSWEHVRARFPFVSHFHKNMVTLLWHFCWFKACTAPSLFCFELCSAAHWVLSFSFFFVLSSFCQVESLIQQVAEESGLDVVGQLSEARAPETGLPSAGQSLSQNEEDQLSRR